MDNVDNNCKCCFHYMPNYDLSSYIPQCQSLSQPCCKSATYNGEYDLCKRRGNGYNEYVKYVDVPTNLI